MAMGSRRILIMWNYEKRLQYPIKITQTNPRLAMAIASQYGGAHCNKDIIKSLPNLMDRLQLYLYLLI